MLFFLHVSPTFRRWSAQKHMKLQENSPVSRIGSSENRTSHWEWHYESHCSAHPGTQEKRRIFFKLRKLSSRWYVTGLGCRYSPVIKHGWKISHWSKPQVCEFPSWPCFLMFPCQGGLLKYIYWTIFISYLNFWLLSRKWSTLPLGMVN
jgi:hypothetical protein